MTLTPDQLAVVLRGRRTVPDEHSDDYFQYIAAALRMTGGDNIHGIVKTAVQMFRHPTKCVGCG